MWRSRIRPIRTAKRATLDQLCQCFLPHPQLRMRPATVRRSRMTRRASSLWPITRQRPPHRRKSSLEKRLHHHLKPRQKVQDFLLLRVTIITLAIQCPLCPILAMARCHNHHILARCIHRHTPAPSHMVIRTVHHHRHLSLARVVFPLHLGFGWATCHQSRLHLLKVAEPHLSPRLKHRTVHHRHSSRDLRVPHLYSLPSVPLREIQTHSIRLETSRSILPRRRSWETLTLALRRSRCNICNLSTRII